MSRIVHDRSDDAPAQAKNTASHAVRGTMSNRWVKGVARMGLAGRGVMYLIVSYLSLKVATARSARPADNAGAMQTIAHHPWGHVLLAVLAVGFGGYSVWRLSEAAVGHEREADAKKRQAKRLASLVKGVLYGAICFATAMLSAGRGSGGGADTKSAPWTARLMKLTFGRGLVAGIGASIVIVGGYFVVNGVRAKFRQELDTGQMHPTMEKVVVGLGLIGNVARGMVTAVAGLFLVKAAADFKPTEAKGLDGTLRTIAARPYGGPLLIATALGLFAFGLYSFFQARFSTM